MKNQNNLRALSGRAIVQPLDEVYSGVLQLPQTAIDRAGNIIKARVLSSGIPDLVDGSVVHCRAELGYRVPMSSARIYLSEDILLVEV